ncbi:MAG TPA: RNA polymerase sigma-54 factor [Sediminispirochaeta sp.]|nr:RNA polymerase sigma-54 factor [Sediminispirochaeta sp.]
MQYQKPVIVQQQKLKMSPQLYQSIKLMAMPMQELKLKIQEELEQNPALEVVDESPEISIEEMSSGTEDYDYFENSSDPGRLSSYDQEASDSKQKFIEGALTRPESLHDHLMWQLRLQPIPSDWFRVGELLIWNLDQNGFHLEDPLKLVPVELRKHLPEVQRLIQQLDPQGTCTRDYRESLKVQAALSPAAPPGAVELIDQYFELLEKRSISDITKKTKFSTEEVEAVIDFLKTLTPYPGRLYSNEETTYVIPDVLVRHEEGEFRLYLNDEDIPRLGISPIFSEMESETIEQAKEDRRFVKRSVRDAQWFISSIEQRNQTLLKIARCIFEFQRKFFLYGPKQLAPLTLKDVAAEVKVHETTVSRIVNSKYIQTEWGIFPLKYFFSNQVSSTGNNRYSKEAVKEIIREIIAENSENGKKLSDQKISDSLKKRGISIARRTVTKYRKELDIDSSYYR